MPEISRVQATPWISVTSLYLPSTRQRGCVIRSELWRACVELLWHRLITPKMYIQTQSHFRTACCTSPPGCVSPYIWHCAEIHPNPKHASQPMFPIVLGATPYIQAPQAKRNPSISSWIYFLPHQISNYLRPPKSFSVDSPLSPLPPVPDSPSDSPTQTTAYGCYSQSLSLNPYLRLCPSPPSHCKLFYVGPDKVPGTWWVLRKHLLN